MKKISTTILLLLCLCNYALAESHESNQSEIHPGTQALIEDGETPASIKRILSKSVPGLSIDGYDFRVSWQCKGSDYYSNLTKNNARFAIEASSSYREKNIEPDSNGEDDILTWTKPIATRIFYNGGEDEHNFDHFIATWTYNQSYLFINYFCDGIQQHVRIDHKEVASIIGRPKGYQENDRARYDNVN